MELNSPYGGELVDLLEKGKEREALLAEASTLPSLQLSDRAVCDLELLARRLLAARPLHGRGRLPARAGRDAPGRRHALPDPVTLPVADERRRPAAARTSPCATRKNDLLAVMTRRGDLPVGPRARRRSVVSGTHGPAPPAGGRDGALGQALHRRAAAGA